MKKRMLAALVALCLLLAPALAMARQYIIPDSDTRRLTETELWDWDYESLGYILNEIFARYGYVFQSGGQYEAYFSKLSWYTKNASDDNQTLVYNRLTALEWDNEALVKEVRAQMRNSGNYNTGGKHYLDYITFDEDTGGEYETELDFTYQSFSANQKFAVYSAPSTSSYRGANGKACVSTNGPVYVAGWEDGWLLVMYDTNSGAVRVGYVRGSEISGSVSAPYLAFAYTKANCTCSVNLTDDPLTGSTAIVRLAEGQQVTFLAVYNGGGNWAYVETTVGGQSVRGFLPLSTVQ
ncbi:MAG TPA: YARHG domain-containing protein [Candidatus Limiplasma sp.]|nr:YARHG domain-containing protein [Candidatus Limiplasma sp.]